MNHMGTPSQLRDELGTIGRIGRRAKRTLAVVVPGALALSSALSTGCIVDNHKADTAIEFQETDNIGQYCNGPLSSWTVVNRETGKQATAGCEQPVLFESLSPGAEYTFDVSGYAGNKLCWQGSCSVVAVSGTTTYADCKSSIASLCGY
jgi:hypothetical protein